MSEEKKIYIVISPSRESGFKGKPLDIAVTLCESCLDNKDSDKKEVTVPGLYTCDKCSIVIQVK